MKTLPPTKASLRKMFLRKRLCLPMSEYRMRCIGLAEQAMAWCEQHHPPCVHIFLSHARRKEPDTWPLVHMLWKRGIPTLTMTKEDTAVCFDAQRPLQKNEWNMLEPVCSSRGLHKQSAKTLLQTPGALCFVPLLLFDKQGHRLGYGQGMYDRFLAEHPGLFSIGLSLAPPIAAIPKIDPYDQRMNACITPWKTYRFQHAPSSPS